MLREIKESKAESTFIGELPKGCRQCIRGEKLVMFVTGICPNTCFFCPLSENRKNIDNIFANEVPVKKDLDIIDEARACSAKGAGVTGGDPLSRLERTLHYIRILKAEFGERFHTHLYTSGELATPDVLLKLESAGLDEIRYHIQEDPKVLLPALSTNMDVGAEVPVIPGEEEKLKATIKFLDETKAKFVNLNELEMSELNAAEMRKRGFDTDGNLCNSITGSFESAEKIMHWAQANTKQISLHFCNSRVKDVYQYNKRLGLRAKNLKKPYETIARGCLLRKGVIFDATTDDAKKLCKEYTFRRGRIECSVLDAKRAAKSGFRAAIVLENPAHDCFDVEVEPIKSKKAILY